MTMVMVMRRRFTCLRGAAFTVHPARIAVDVVFFFPDRYPVFHLVDDESARRERLGTMARTPPYPPRHVADRKRANAMNACGVLDSEALDRRRDDTLAFLDGK